MPEKQFIRRILIIAEPGKILDEMTRQFRNLSKKVKTDKIIDRQLLSSALANNLVNGVFLCSNEVQDTKFALRLLGMYKLKTNPDIKISFTSPDFDTFQQVLSESSLDSVQVVPWPIDYHEVASQLLAEIFDQSLSRKITLSNKQTVDFDLEFIEVFIQATKKTIQEMGGVQQIDHEKPKLIKNEKVVLEDGISSKITISSEFFSGDFYVIFPTQSFLKLYESAVGEKSDTISDENQDFAGELANIIYGQSKKIFAASGLNLDMVIPSTELKTTFEEEFTILSPFSCSVGKFYISVVPKASQQ